MTAEALREALAALGLRGRVETRGSLAILTLEGDATPLRDAQTRAHAVSVASEHGFTHLAFEVPGTRSDDAAVHRD